MAGAPSCCGTSGPGSLSRTRKEGFATGKLKVRLFGERMSGGWALVRMKPKAGEKRENWLLIKEKDEAATSDGEAILKADKSVSTGRTMSAIAKGKEPAKTSACDD